MTAPLLLVALLALVAVLASVLVWTGGRRRRSYSRDPHLRAGDVPRGGNPYMPSQVSRIRGYPFN